MTYRDVPKRQAEAVQEIPKHLKQFEELRDAGTITPEDYQTKRAENLKSL